MSWLLSKAKKHDKTAFQQLIEDIRNGEVATLITKDLSRLGRNYLETGTYIEVFFPNHNVRYIAINDGVDSIDKSKDSGNWLLRKQKPVEQSMKSSFCLGILMLMLMVRKNQRMQNT